MKSPDVKVFPRIALTIAAVGSFLIGCSDDDSEKSTLSTVEPASGPDTPPTASEGTVADALIGGEAVGVVPGIVTFDSGEVVVRPFAQVGEDISCSGGDAALHDDADTLTYRQNDELVTRSIDEVSEVKIDKPEFAQADQESADFLLRQCITQEGEVITGKSGYCAPIGSPDPNSRRIAVGTSSNAALAQGIMSNDC